MRTASIFLLLIPIISGFKLEKSRDIPPTSEPTKLARWVIHNSCNLMLLLLHIFVEKKSLKSFLEEKQLIKSG